MVAADIRTLLNGLAGDIDFTVERPNQPEHGDFATNAVLIAAKREGVNPRALAEKWQAELQTEELFESVEVAGPGFLNFRLKPAVWHAELQKILDEADNYGQQPSTNQKIQVEFISANPTGPLTLANGRGGFSGDVLARVLAKGGFAVEREYYINDAGNQILTLGRSIKGEEEAYRGAYIEELRAELDTSADAAEVGRVAAERLLGSIKATVALMGITFDDYVSERELLHDSGAIAKVLDDLAKAGATYEQDGALWLKTTEFGDDKDRVLRKADGEVTYLSADLAHYRWKLVEKGFDVAINILGADHHGYVGRMQAGVEWLRKSDQFEGHSVILITQLVRLIQSGKEVKMSKRAGTYVALDDLLDEIPADVARFFFVMKSFDTHMDFDLDLAKEQSQKNPVYYLKYAHARVSSILDKAGEPAGQVDLDRLTEPPELRLISKLADYPEIIARTAGDYQVHRVAHYALEVADTFHKFYETTPVISDDADLTAARVTLMRGTKQLLANLGETLGIEMPEKM